MRRLRFLIPALLPLAALAGEYLPLETGNTWTYRNAATGQSFTMRVGTPTLVNNQVYYALIGYVSKTVLARVDREFNQIVYLNEEANRELPLTTFQPVEGAWWIAPLRACEQEGQAQAKPGSHDGPSGPFGNVLNVNYRVFSCADAGVSSEQYAENVGMLRRVQNTFAGPVQYDLVYARVGKAVVDAQRHARFSVSVDAPENSNFANITLRLETNGSSPFTLRFPSGQEYDAQVLDAQGNTLWTWSAGILFTQAEHSLDVNGVWTATVQAPVSAVSRGALVTAFLTSKPRFEVSAPLDGSTVSARDREWRPGPPIGRKR